MRERDKKFVYQGPISGVTLQGGREVMFHPGREVSLPESNSYVARLVAQGRLIPIPPAGAESVSGLTMAGGPGTGRPAAVVLAEERRAIQEDGGFFQEAAADTNPANPPASRRGKKSKRPTKS